jgi:phosphate:Na+ symporter
VVALITLGFVEAGMIPFKNALGVIMGSNIGSTIVGWIVATIGFKMDIETLAMPGLAISTIAMFFARSRKKIYNTLRVIFSISLLFFGLGLMKQTSEQLFKQFDITIYQHYPLIIFLVIGFIITSLIQTSSATMAIALTALNTNAITLPAAAAVIIGSEVGTSIKTLIAGFKGSSEKKRASYGNFYFNLVTTVLAFVFLHQLLAFIIDILHIHDPLIALVFFQTLINLLTLIMFLPFINRFSSWLEKRFTNSSREVSYVRKDLDQFTELTPALLKEEVQMLLQKNFEFHELVLDTERKESEGLINSLRNFARRSGTTREEYDKLKTSEGELLEFFTGLNETELSQEEQDELNNSMEALRQVIHSAKSVKDIHHNITELRESANDQLHGHFHRIGEAWKAFRSKLQRTQTLQELNNLLDEAFSDLETNNEKIRNEIRDRKLEDIQASTMMNIEREILSSKKSLISAWKKLMLSES